MSKHENPFFNSLLQSHTAAMQDATPSTLLSTLVVGSDSAWTQTKSGAIVGALFLDDGNFVELGPPIRADYREAQAIILGWPAERTPTATMVMLDQPTINLWEVP